MFLIAESKMIIKADSRLLLYFPVYAIGIFAGEYCKHYVINFSFWNIYNIIGILIFLLFCSIYIAGICKYILLNLLLISITSFVLILNLSKIMIKLFPVKIINMVSKSSLCVYLFHNQYFWFNELIFGKLSIIYAYTIVIPSLVIICYYVQKIYEKMITYKK